MDPQDTEGSKMTFLIPIKKDQKPFKCGLCSFSFDIILQLDDHVSEHSLTKPFQCGFCQVSYATSSELTLHVDTHQLFMCVAKGATTETLLQANGETGNFKAKDNCSSNMRNPASRSVSGGERSSATRKHFNSSKQHPKGSVTDSSSMKTAGTDCIPCRICGQMFKCQVDLKKHSVTDHADDRPFHCTQCPSRFKQNIHLRDHMFSVHGSNKPHVCPFCSENFKIRNYLRNHIARKHPYNLVAFVKSKNKTRKEDAPDRSGENGSASKRRSVSELQLSAGNTESVSVSVTAVREGGDISDADRTTSDHAGNSRISEDEEDSEDNGGNGEDDEALPHTFSTSSFSTDSTPPVFAAPQTPALWNLSQDQLEMKVEVDFDSSDRAAQDTNVCVPQTSGTGLVLGASYNAPAYSKHE